MKKLGKYKVTKKQAANKKPANKPVKESFPHFRRYSKSGHPALIVGEQVSKDKEEYRFRKVMHNERDGDRPNEKVFPNPDPTDKRPMYLGKRVRHDEKRYFGSRLPWKYPKK